MEVVVNGGKGAGVTNIKDLLESLQEHIKGIENPPACFKDFTITFDDGYSGDKYIYKLRVGNMILESIGDNVELSYYNANTDGSTTSMMLGRRAEDIIDIAVGIGIFGKVFESMLLPISLLRQTNEYKNGWGEQQHIYFSTTYGNTFMLSKRKYPFRYELAVNGHSAAYKGEMLNELLKDNGKCIMETIEKSMKK